MPAKPPLLSSSSASSLPPLCPRCSLHRCATVHRQQPLCGDCFLSSFVLRFKQRLRRGCAVPLASRVAVAWSGGLHSSALCRLLREGRQEEGRHRLLVHQHTVHVDCAAIKRPRSDEERAADDAERCSLAAAFHAHLHVLPLSAVLDIPSASSSSVSSSTPSPSSPFYPLDPSHRSAADERLRALFRACDPSSHASLLRCLLHHLLSHWARREGFAAVVSGETSTYAASACLAALLKGQGRRVASLTSPAERRLGVRWAHPLRDCTATAVAYYFHHRQLQALSSLAPIHVPSAAALPTRGGAPVFPRVAPTVEGAAAAFVRRLDAQFPQTVSNVLRTVEKVEGPEAGAPVCAWCGYVAYEGKPSSAQLSTAAHGGEGMAGMGGGEAEGPPLCYDCERAFGPLMGRREGGEDDVVPAFIRHFDCQAGGDEEGSEGSPSQGTADGSGGAEDSAAVSGSARSHHAGGGGQRQSRAAMRAQIAEFLLEESSHGQAASEAVE